MYKGIFKSIAFQWLAGIILFSSCTKIDTTSIGAGLIPAVDNIHTFDTTLRVVANNFDAYPDCEFISSNDLQALGIINNDPLFGNSKADMFLELKPVVYPLQFPEHAPDSLFIDSVVLVLSYNHSFGDTSIMQNVKVFPLKSELVADSIYSTCTLFNYNRNWLLGQKTYVPAALNDSVHAYKEDAANQLRIPLNDSLIWNFIRDSALLTNDSIFNKNFEGFALIADSITGGNALNYFYLKGRSTRLSVYMRGIKDGKQDTTILDLAFTDLSGSANTIFRDRGGALISQYLDTTKVNDSLLFVQTVPGTYVKLDIPALDGFPNAVVNRAELVFDEVYDPTNVFNVPHVVMIEIWDTAAKRFIPIPCDFSMSEVQAGLRNFGGRSQEVEDAGGNQIHRYVFNISRYVQSIITKNERNATIRLRAPFYYKNDKPYQDRCGQVIQEFVFPANPIADGRVLFHGSGTGSNSLRLNIIYSTP